MTASRAEPDRAHRTQNKRRGHTCSHHHIPDSACSWIYTGITEDVEGCCWDPHPDWAKNQRNTCKYVPARIEVRSSSYFFKNL
jgi:hypothetical protein